MADTVQNLQSLLAPLFEEFNASLRVLLSQSLDSGFSGVPDPFDEAVELRDLLVQRVAGVAAAHVKGADKAELGAMWQRLASMAENHLGAAPTAQELAQATVDAVRVAERRCGGR